MPCRFVEAAKALARLVSDEDRAAGALFPPVAAAGEVGDCLFWVPLQILLCSAGSWFSRFPDEVAAALLPPMAAAGEVGGSRLRCALSAPLLVAG